MFLRFAKQGVMSSANVLQSAIRSASKNSYVWMDLEMTGLNPAVHHILEVSCIVTNPNLEYVHKGINLVIHQSEEVLNSMNDWCRESFAKSGLTEESRNSKISLPQAEVIITDYIKKHTKPDGVNYLAGNSVYTDKMFLNKYMPLVDILFHYRIIDVSSIKTLVSHWYPEIYEKLPGKKLAHRALDDIRESIEELKKYKETVFL